MIDANFEELYLSVEQDSNSCFSIQPDTNVTLVGRQDWNLALL
jgi:hypothetical protein